MRLFLSSLFLLTACAEPKYLSAPEKQAAGPEKATTTCSAKFTSGECLYWIWEKMPTSREKGSLLFRIYLPDQSDGFPISTDTRAEASVVLWMPSMNHGSTPTTVTKIGAGQFRVSNVFFVMPGDWEIKFQLRDENANVDEAVVSLIF